MQTEMTDRQILEMIEGVGLQGEDVCTDIGMDLIKKRPVSKREKELYDLFIRIWEISHWRLSSCCKSEEHDKKIREWYCKLEMQGYVREEK